METKLKIAKIPWKGPQPMGFAFFGRIYLREVFWNEYKSGKPSAKTLSIIKHEETHVERMGNDIKLHLIFWLNKSLDIKRSLLQQ